MKTADPAILHKLYTTNKPRAIYYKRDFIDYIFMVVLSALAVGFSYGWRNAISIIAFALCAFEIAAFVLRHGVEWTVPLIFKRPAEAFYLISYKLRNLKPAYVVALGLLTLETLVIRATPNLPHHVDWMRKGALYLFYIHLISITFYRTVSLIDHLLKREMIREILMQTPWQRAIKEDTNMTLEIVHAYCTGVLSHIILLAPWYMVIVYARFSLVFLVPVGVLNIIIHQKWLKTANSWFYRDHWLGHNSEFEFVYLHGSHHDAIPSGLIAVSENGFLEGFFRHTIGWPNPFYTPLIAFALYMFEIKGDIELHQYIPGVFPRLSKEGIELYQHSTHHYGPLEPYGFAFKLGEKGAYKFMPEEMRNAIELDEQMGFKWDNPTFRRTKALYDKYHNVKSKLKTQ